MKTLNNYLQLAVLCSGLLLLLFSGSCKEDIGIEAARIGEKPEALKNVSFKEAPGGAIITYNLPSTEDLRYVKAVYTLENGRKMVSKASLYTNEVLVEGYARIGEHDIQLVAVSVGDVESEPITIKVKTGKPNYIKLAESFKTDDFFYSTFGGVNVQYFNEDASNLIISVLKYDLDTTFNKMAWNILNQTYTKAKEGVIRVRGEKPIPLKFAVVVRDQWGNLSDTIARTMTPEEEFELKDLSIFKGIQVYSEMNRNGDYTANYSAQTNSAEMQTALFDMDIPNSRPQGKQWWGKAAPIPFQFTIDTKRSVQVSRVKMWGRNDNNSLLFQATHPKEFELFGSNDPAADGSWESWTSLGVFEGVRPSGLAFGTNANEEDITYARNGEDFEVNWSHPGGFRYYRIKINCTWNGVREQPLGNALTVAIAELKLFGKYLD